MRKVSEATFVDFGLVGSKARPSIGGVARCINGLYSVTMVCRLKLKGVTVRDVSVSANRLV